MTITNETFKNMSLLIGVLAGISSLMGIISILVFHNNYSYIAIGAGLFSSYILLDNYFKG